MIEYLLSDPFVAGVIVTVLGLLILVMVVPAFTRKPQRWKGHRPEVLRVIEPAERLPTVEAKRIEVH